MVVYRLLMYTPMGWSRAASIASSNDGYSYYSHALSFSIIPVIYHAARWWNYIRTLIIYQVTTPLSLSYNSTKCATTLYITPRALTTAPVLYSTPPIMPQRLQDLHRFRYTTTQLLLL